MSETQSDHLLESNEREAKSPSIRLEFFRHDERMGTKPGEQNINSRLTVRGCENATSIGKNKSPHPEVAIAYGSPRERSIETALRQMLSNATEIKQTTDLEALRNLVLDKIRVGKKDLVSDKLDFNWSGEFEKIALDRYNNGDYLLFEVEESDDLVKKLHDMISTSYTRQAAGVAELVKKYIEILPRWSQITNDNPEKFDQFDNELQRFLGSHATVIEAFLLKVIEKTEGKAEVKKFIEELPNKNGFGYSEGFSVEIKNHSSTKEPMVEIKYKDKLWTTNPETIDQIIKDRELLDSVIKK